MQFDRRSFIKKSVIYATVTFASQAMPFKALFANNKLTLTKPLLCVTNTNNWVLVGGSRKNLFEYNVDGVNNYCNWSDLEPKKGVFNWNGFDRLVAEARKANKKFSYNILAGKHTPDWVYTEVNQQPYKYEVDLARVQTFLPWKLHDGILQLNVDVLNVWRESIMAFSKKINSLPDKSLLSYIAITGGPTANGLEIMWGQDKFKDFSKLEWDLSKEAIFIEYWKRLIDIYFDNFDGVPLGLGFTDFFGVEATGFMRRNYAIPEAILHYGITSAKTRHKIFVPMILWIGKLKYPFDSHPGLKLLKRLGVPFAIQGEMGTDTPARLDAILKYAKENEVQWVELWHHDIVSERYQSLIANHRQTNY